MMKVPKERVGMMKVKRESPKAKARIMTRTVGHVERKATYPNNARNQKAKAEKLESLKDGPKEDTGGEKA